CDLAGAVVALGVVGEREMVTISGRKEDGAVFLGAFAGGGFEGWGEVVADAGGAVDGDAQFRAAFGFGGDGCVRGFVVRVEVAEEHAGVSAAAGEANLSGEGDWIVKREGADVVGVIAVEGIDGFEAVEGAADFAFLF